MHLVSKVKLRMSTVPMFALVVRDPAIVSKICVRRKVGKEMLRRFEERLIGASYRADCCGSD